MKALNWKELRTKKRFWIAMVILGALIVEGVIVGNYFVKKYQQQQKSPRYQVVIAKTTPLITLGGRLAAGQMLDLTPSETTNTKITVVNYADNTAVAAGSVLATAENSQLEDQLAKLQVKLSGLNQQINAQKAVITSTTEQLNQTKNKQKANIKPKLESAKQKLAGLVAYQDAVKEDIKLITPKARYTIKAPYAGYVLVGQGTDGYTLKLSSQALVLDGVVSEYDYATVKAAISSAKVKIAATNQTISGKLVELKNTPSYTQDGVAYYQYKINLNSAKSALSGQTAAATLYHAGVVVAPSSLVTVKKTIKHKQQKATFVYVVKQGVAIRTQVSTTRYNGQTYVLTNLKAGDVVVKQPDATLLKTTQKKVSAYE